MFWWRLKLPTRSIAQLWRDCLPRVYLLMSPVKKSPKTNKSFEMGWKESSSFPTLSMHFFFDVSFVLVPNWRCACSPIASRYMGRNDEATPLYKSDGSKGFSLSLPFIIFNESVRMWAIKFRLDNYKSSWCVVHTQCVQRHGRSYRSSSSLVASMVEWFLCEKWSHFRRVSCRLGVFGHISTASSFTGFWRKNRGVWCFYFDSFYLFSF